MTDLMGARVDNGVPALTDLGLESGYTSSSVDLLEDFYIPCLGAAIRYDRAVGYFRSSLYALTGVAMSDFAHRGGRCRMICSPRLHPRDVEAIEEGYELRQRIDAALKLELEQILEDPENTPVITFLSTLIAIGTLELRLALKPTKAGLFHDKVGIYQDGSGNSISFVGSVNETHSGWSLTGNHEHFEVFASWTDQREARRVERHHTYFEELWESRRSGLRVVRLPEGTGKLLNEYVHEDGIESAAEQVRELIRSRVTTHSSGACHSSRTLFRHQEQAVQEWNTARGSGIVKHATGSGKTVTAVRIVKEWTDEQRPAIVLVPSLVLLDQWIAELEVDLGAVSMLRVSGESRDRGWHEQLPDFTRKMSGLGPRITVATIQSARTEKFRNRVQDGEHLLLVVDEVHRAGSEENSKIFGIEAGGRLGLSATPERYGDPSGTRKILDYFGGILDCEFTLRDAVESGRLVPYDYHIHEVSLSPGEQEEWTEATERIAEAYAKLPDDGKGGKEFTEYFRRLLIDRARIIKQAEGKVDLAGDLLSEVYSDGDRWLVYCDSQAQLRGVTAILRTRGLPTYTYHSNMAGSREATMEYFRSNPCILVAIRCLDEGVDVPAANGALVLASSSNPREYIQRRGRVLRTADGKYSAVIHDALVVPRSGEDMTGVETLLGTEIGRAVVFAELARNRLPVAELRDIARRFGVTLSDLADDRLAYESTGSDTGGEETDQ